MILVQPNSKILKAKHYMYSFNKLTKFFSSFFINFGIKLTIFAVMNSGDVSPSHGFLSTVRARPTDAP